MPSLRSSPSRRGAALSGAAAPGVSSAEYAWLAAALALGALSRAVCVFYVPVMIAEPSYAGTARTIAEGAPFFRTMVLAVTQGLDPLRTPTYPLFLACVAGAVGMQGAAFAAAHHALGLVTAYLIYLLARRLGGRWAGAAALLLYALDLNYPLYESSGYSETLMAPLVLGSVYTVLVLREKARLAPRLAAGGGIVAAAAVLCRPEFALFGALPMAFLAAPKKYGFGARRNALLFSGVCFAVLFAWTARNRLAYGSFILTSNGPVTFLQRTYSLVDVDTPKYPEAKAALRDAQSDKLRAGGDVAHVAQDLLRQRYGMTQVETARVLGQVWEEAVLTHPRAFLAMSLANFRSLFLPPMEGIRDSYERMLRERWPPESVARMERKGFFALALSAEDWSGRLETAIAWASLAGMALALFSPDGVFVLAAYLSLWIAVAVSATHYRYYFELQPFQIIFTSAALGCFVERARRRGSESP